MLDIFRTLPGLMTDGDVAEEFRQALVFAAWRRIAGEALAEHTAPIRLEGSTLTVAVRSLTWQRHLKDLGGQMLFKINAALGTPMVSFIQLDIDEREVTREREARAGREGLDLSDAEEQIDSELVYAASKIEDEELRKRFLAAAGNCLVRRSRREVDPKESA